MRSKARIAQAFFFITVRSVKPGWSTQSVRDPNGVADLARWLADTGLGEKDLIDRIKDTFICPIVFNVVEWMKVELAWHGNDDLGWFDG
jgi:hypothetical protein